MSWNSCDHESGIFILEIPRTGKVPQTKMTCYQGENCALMGYYTASSGNFLLTFRGNLTGPIFRGLESKKWDRTDRLS